MSHTVMTSTRRAAVKARRVGALLFTAVLAVLMVVLVPSEAWATSTLAGSLGPFTVGSGTASVSVYVDSATQAHAVFTFSGVGAGYYVMVETECGTTWDNYPDLSARGDFGSGGVYTGGLTAVCGGGNIAMFRVWSNTSNTLSGATQQGLIYATPATPSTCSPMPTATVSYVGGNLAADLKVTGTPPAGGWKVFVPGDGHAVGTGTPQAVIGTTASAPGEYFSSTAVTLSGITGGTGFRIEKATASGCYVTGSVNVTAAVVPGVASNGTDSSGADCGLNPFCYISSALQGGFVPSQTSLTQYQTLGASIANVVPFGYVSDVLGGFSNFSNGCGDGCDKLRITNLAFDLGDHLRDPSNTMNDTLIYPFRNNAVTDFLTSQRPILSIFAWLAIFGPIAGLVWNRLMPFSGGEGE